MKVTEMFEPCLEKAGAETQNTHVRTQTHNKRTPRSRNGQGEVLWNTKTFKCIEALKLSDTRLHRDICWPLLTIVTFS